MINLSERFKPQSKPAAHRFNRVLGILGNKIVKNPVDRRSFLSHYYFHFCTRHPSFDSFAALTKAGCGNTFVCPLSVRGRFWYDKPPAERNSSFFLLPLGAKRRQYLEI